MVFWPSLCLTGFGQPCASATSSDHAEHMAVVLLTLLGNVQQSAEHMRGVRPELAAGSFAYACPLLTR